jgi:hypothetical protein
MHFKARYDRWLVVVLIVAGFLTCVFLPAVQYLTADPRAIGWTFLIPPVWAIVLFATLPQYCELREDGLFVRQGCFRWLIPYEALVSAESTVDWRSAGVYSSQRILLTTREGKRILVALAEEERFFSELARRCPRLEPRPFGLGTPFSPLSII